MVGIAEQRVSFESMFEDDDDDLPLAWGAPEDLIVVDDEDDGEFLGALVPGVIGSVVNAGAQAVSKLFSPGRPKTVTTKPAVNHASGIRGKQTGSVMTPGGPVNVRMGAAYITPSQLQHAMEGVRRDINALQTATRVSDQRQAAALTTLSKTTATAISAETAKRTAELKKVEARLDKKIDDARQFSLLSMLMGGKDEDGGDDMLPLMLMMGGGLGGGSGSGSGSSNDLLMILALSGKL